MSHWKLLCVALLAVLVPIAGHAADFDGTKNLVCAPADIAECGVGPACAGVTTDETNVPEFIAVDFGAKRLSDRSHGGSTETTAIQNVRQVDGRLVLRERSRLEHRGRTGHGQHDRECGRGGG